MKTKQMVALLLCIALLLTCSVGMAEEDAKKAYAGTTIKVLLQSHVTSESMVRFLSEFEEETGITVEAEIIPYSELHTKASLAFSQGDDYYDVFFDSYIYRSGYVANNYVYALDDFVADDSLNMYVDMSDFIDGYRAAGQQDGNTYMLPVYGESVFFMYRKDIFEEYGIEVPTTLDEVFEAAKTVYEKSGGSIYGIALRGSKTMLTLPYAIYLWSCGGRWFDEEGHCVVDSPESIKAVELYVDVMTNYAPAGYANFGWPETRVAFDQGLAAMCMDATVNGAYNETAEESTVAGKVGYTTIPLQVSEDKLYGYPCSLTAHGLYLSKFSKNPEAAFLFMTWASSAGFQQQSLTVSADCGATSKTVFKSEAFQSKYGAFVDAMVNAVNVGNPEFAPTITQAAEVKARVCAAVSSVLAGETTAQEAMTSVAAEINRDILGFDD